MRSPAVSVGDISRRCTAVGVEQAAESFRVKPVCDEPDLCRQALSSISYDDRAAIRRHVVGKTGGIQIRPIERDARGLELEPVRQRDVRNLPGRAATEIQSIAEVRPQEAAGLKLTIPVFANRWHPFGKRTSHRTSAPPYFCLGCEILIPAVFPQTGRIECSSFLFIVSSSSRISESYLKTNNLKSF